VLPEHLIYFGSTYFIFQKFVSRLLLPLLTACIIIVITAFHTLSKATKITVEDLETFVRDEFKKSEVWYTIIRPSTTIRRY